MTAHIPKNHPVRYLIEAAANGRKLTAGDLELLGNADLPTNESLTTFTAAVDSAARRVAAVGATGNRNDAINLAETEWSTLAGRMTPDQLAVDTTSKADDRSVDDMIARIFSN